MYHPLEVHVTRSRGAPLLIVASLLLAVICISPVKASRAFANHADTIWEKSGQDALEVKEKNAPAENASGYVCQESSIGRSPAPIAMVVTIAPLAEACWTSPHAEIIFSRENFPTRVSTNIERTFAESWVRPVNSLHLTATINVAHPRC